MRAFSPAAHAFTRPYRLVGGPVRPGGGLRKRGAWNVLEPEREWFSRLPPGPPGRCLGGAGHRCRTVPTAPVVYLSLARYGNGNDDMNPAFGETRGKSVCPPDLGTGSGRE